MAKIYGYSLTVSTRGKCEERLEEQKKAIKEISRCRNHRRSNGIGKI